MQAKAETKKGRLKAPLAIFFALVLGMTALLGSGAITVTVQGASGDFDVEYVPGYRDVTCVLDPIQNLQRFDSVGDWNLIGTPLLDDSTMTAGQNQGMNLTVADSATVDGGTYFEIRVKTNSTAANCTMLLDEFSSSNQAAIGLGLTKIVYSYYDGTDLIYGNLGTTFAANTWYRLGINFVGDDVAFSAYADNYTLIDSDTVSDCAMAYADVDSIIIRETAAVHTATFDYFFQTEDRTSKAEATYTSVDLNLDPSRTEKFEKMKIDFGDKDMVPGSYSDQDFVHAAYNYTLTGKDIANDRYLNQTDFGEILNGVKETKTPVTGQAKYMGWQDLYHDNELNLQNYLADHYKVSIDQVGIVDYYVSSMGLNYTWTASVQDKVESFWYSAMKSIAGDLGGGHPMVLS